MFHVSVFYTWHVSCLEEAASNAFNMARPGANSQLLTRQADTLPITLAKVAPHGYRIKYKIMLFNTQLDVALAYDALKVIQMTIVQILANDSAAFKYTFRRREVYNYNKTKGVPCIRPVVPWMHGDALITGMKKVLHKCMVIASIRCY